MKSQRIAMTIDEFHVMPRKLGGSMKYNRIADDETTDDKAADVE
ncbi:MAG: hypothetical protein ACOYNY_14460 [Caldilineaceae bacterium]